METLIDLHYINSIYHSCSWLNSDSFPSGYTMKNNKQIYSWLFSKIWISYTQTKFRVSVVEDGIYYDIPLPTKGWHMRLFTNETKYAFKITFERRLLAKNCPEQFRIHRNISHVFRTPNKNKTFNWNFIFIRSFVFYLYLHSFWRMGNTRNNARYGPVKYMFNGDCLSGTLLRTCQMYFSLVLFPPDEFIKRVKPTKSFSSFLD